MLHKISAFATKYAAFCVRRPQNELLCRGQSPKGFHCLSGAACCACCTDSCGVRSVQSIFAKLYANALLTCIHHTRTHSHTDACVCRLADRNALIWEYFDDCICYVSFFFVASLLKCSHKKTYQIFFSSRVKLNGAKELQIKHSPEYI